MKNLKKGDVVIATELLQLPKYYPYSDRKIKPHDLLIVSENLGTADIQNKDCVFVTFENSNYSYNQELFIKIGKL